MTRSNKTVRAPKAAPLKAKKPKQPKSEPRIVEHKTLGVCTLRCIRALDSSDLVAVVEFSGGTERVIRLDERFWLTRITEMMQAPLEPARKYRAEPKRAKPVDEGEEVAAERELELADGHIQDGEIEDASDAETEEDGVQQDAKLVGVG
jgi:hypothetical protein